MITKEEIIDAPWDGHSKEELAKILEDYEVLGGEYDSGGYEESIYGLLRHKDGRLFEFYSCHCSCFGFAELQIEEVELEALIMREKEGYSGGIGSQTHKALKEAGLLSAKI